MAGDVPSLGSLDKPENLNDLLRADRGDDCTSCRVIGGGAFLGLAGYNYLTGMSHLEKQRAALLQRKTMFGMRSRKLGVTGISLGLAYLGIWRLFK
ncbi:conserved hypothetical protein [Verticillium alfalfae VaMs.102]|uniref:Distal membrane-arm assembly complex protein 1-like domain-containing protein n=1 Tax=Verticillium alfalfae (strain VaMs.102 / ATCC MYA-4576 / FGSC 10136) TaxID=526221 RepID=C9S554_VERA1|nr:conserved hypothetical protein [Verticillium alfalfae VaMs.102]EEY14154.1 conserved hypothetical protein [Verticillium alfalfae VaMs.102]